ncbi:short-chain dehydrogenase/reductase 3 [Platysternon megacephalum]|uniref:Chemerin-like receptor 1 n=1 Tax=Platysternon megacephalum TaxID=55544 RepID=A0A4D9EUB8_9SAUR|nr:short-chain dehydrogenase/reductase 3 [Platysternon megacephalum]
METHNSSYDYSYYNVYDDDFTTVSVKQEPSHDTKAIARILSVVVYSLTCLLGILGNGLVITIITFKMKKSINAIWFLNLAVADFLFNVFLPLNIAYTAMNYHWVFGAAMCKLSSFLLNLNLYSSVLLLMTISLDRCVSVVLPVWAQNHRTTTLACLICVFDWVIALAMSSPSLVFRDTATHEGKVICFSNYALSGNKSDYPLGMMRHQTVNIVRFLIGFVIPITIITVCYMIIVVKLKRNRLAKSKKPFKIIVTIIVTFFLCWTPYHVLHLLETQHDQVSHEVFKIGIPITTALAAASSCMNPILYVFMGQDFKKFKVTILSRLVNALSEDTTHSTLTHRSFSKMSSMTEKDTTLL